jgi:hypothetical protein
MTCDPACLPDEQCLNGVCVPPLSDDSSGGEPGGCPDGETCQLTGAGTMACLGDPTLCVQPCGVPGSSPCDESMVCEAGACQYDLNALPKAGDPDYPPPTLQGCPDGFVAASFATGFGVCLPMCDGVGPQAACPGAGFCAVAPGSSGQAC